MFKRTEVSAALAIAFGGFLAAVAMPGMAQQEEAKQELQKKEEPKKDAPRLERVEITGSSIKRIDAETAVPVTIIKIDEIKKQGVTTVEQIVSSLGAAQTQQSTSQVVGASTGGAAFADLRGIGANKTLVLLNGRRIANNALDGSSPDLNAIPFAALERVEVLRDGASAVYGTDAVGGVINFITRKDFTGGTLTVGADVPDHPGGKAKSANIGYGFGDLGKDGFNIFGFVDLQKQEHIGGTQRPFNTRYVGGLSPTPFPANYYQDIEADIGNPAAPACNSNSNITPTGDGTSCQETTSSFVDYTPKSERTSAMLKGAFKIDAENQLGLEYFRSQSRVSSQIAPVPYGNLFMNRLRPNGAPNPYYPGNVAGTSITPNISLSDTYTEASTPAGVLPGFIHVKWRDIATGVRQDQNTNTQQRLVAQLDGVASGWDYQAALTYNENKVKEDLSGYSNGPLISQGVLDGVINPFGNQDVAGAALLASTRLSGTIRNAKGTVAGMDAHASREVGDWFGAGRSAAVAVGAEFRKEKFLSKAEHDFAALVISSTGIDPDSRDEGSRKVYAAFTELSVPVQEALDVTAAIRYDKYSDFGNTINPKFGFRFQPNQNILLRSSYSTGFRAPSLFELNGGQAYTNTSTVSDPVLCNPDNPSAAVCDVQFQSLTGGNKDLKPEKSKGFTFGVVLEPVANLSVAMDLWWIRLKQTIGQLSDSAVFGPDFATYASVYHRLPNGTLSTDGSACPNPATCGYVDLRQQNLGGTNTNGADLSAKYQLRYEDLGAFTFGLNTTYVTKFEYQDAEGGAWHQNVGVFSGTGPIFRWQSSASVAWAKGAFGAGLSLHDKSSYVDFRPASFEATRPTNTVGSYTTADAYGSWSPTKALSLTVGVRNLMDRDPPLSFQNQVFQAGYDPRYTDPTGRAYYVRGSYRF